MERYISLMIRRVAAIWVTLLLCTLSNCGVVQDAAYVEGSLPATVGTMTMQNRALRGVPLPDKRVTVSIYDLPDLTGQYKASSTGQTLSRAVTQGGAAILVKGLQDAGERRNVKSLQKCAASTVKKKTSTPTFWGRWHIPDF
jgi:curli production assembly/transport component CsgG